MSTSTASLPSYHYEPRETEHLLAQRLRVHRPRSDFVKNSRNGGVVLRLTGQRDDATLPEYGRGALVEGIVELKNVDTVLSVDVKIEGSLRLKEIAEGGTNTSSLCLDVKNLWNRNTSSERCPECLPFLLALPSTFSDGKATFPLPPSYEAHLSGVPGFTANIDYEVSATVTRHKVSLFGLANTTVSTPINVRPRSRPALPLPSSLTSNFTHPSSIHTEDWAVHQATIKTKAASRGDNIHVKLYLPALHVYSLTEAIPFHLFLTSSAFSLASYLPYAPAVVRGSRSPSDQSDLDLSRSGATRIQLLRQTSVDVRSITKRTTPTRGNNTDIWKTVQIGEAAFRRYGADAGRASLGGGGKDWVAWFGEVRVDRSVKVGSFKASGLNVKDFIVLSMHPPDPAKSPFMDVRLVVPIKLTTDPWSADEYGPDVGIAGYSDSSDPGLEDHEPPELTYNGRAF
ncbi:uncharacterized protein FOMMEDRAFT_169490 [Fomitiporia mediterranea MF3/22]|uniref:uncharacterized protein n=1 Tax=Fomitiporia mediterranea (strain MF3/22) TaxID=694068 RepID=UPI0004409617|nr:uncharacterized protein FOMMEDRAFT_169490 [Fomitiporia mediterranea MF3/22]EJD01352.1 hypothetical protein FOMMEDRAFT_169490 [Fomitiporia mediterranea MF3/22]